MENRSLSRFNNEVISYLADRKGPEKAPVPSNSLLRSLVPAQVGVPNVGRQGLAWPAPLSMLSSVDARAKMMRCSRYRYSK